MHETLEQKDRDIIKIERRESNVILFRVQERVKAEARDRVGDDLSFFEDLCSDGFTCSKNPVFGVIRLGTTPRG